MTKVFNCLKAISLIIIAMSVTGAELLIGSVDRQNRASAKLFGQERPAWPFQHCLSCGEAVPLPDDYCSLPCRQKGAKHG